MSENLDEIIPKAYRVVIENELQPFRRQTAITKLLMSTRRSTFKS